MGTGARLQKEIPAWLGTKGIEPWGSDPIVAQLPNSERHDRLAAVHELRYVAHAGGGGVPALWGPGVPPSMTCLRRYWANATDWGFPGARASSRRKYPMGVNAPDSGLGVKPKPGFKAG